LNILRTIESFLPYVSGPARQAASISEKLEERGISSPVVTSYLDVDSNLPARETLGRVQVTRLPVQFRIMRYAVTSGLSQYLQGADIIHSHNYRNFQTDAAFFLPANVTPPLS
jgi:hypothetical protein